jgi:anti-sigma-K factor RskA
MKHRLALFGVWITSETWRLQMVVFAAAVVLALVAGLIPGGAVFAGPASGGS